MVTCATNVIVSATRAPLYIPQNTTILIIKTAESSFSNAEMPYLGVAMILIRSLQCTLYTPDCMFPGVSREMYPSPNKQRNQINLIRITVF